MRPRIICHMVSSIDGRLLTQRWKAPDGGPAGRLIHEVYEATSARMASQGWMVGRASMAGYADDQREPATLPQPVTRAPFMGERAGRNLAIWLDRLGRLVFRDNDVDGDHAVAIVSERVEDDYLSDLRDRQISYVFSGPDGDDLAGAMGQIGDLFGNAPILLQGGGTVCGAFLAAGLIDEFSTLIFPFVDGKRGIPAIVSYAGDADMPAQGLSFTLQSAETLDHGVVWLRHTVNRNGSDAED